MPEVDGADAVAVENMTVRDVTSNGFYWDGVTGFRGSYLTAINGSTGEDELTRD